MTDDPTAKWIKSIIIEDLFDRYNYQIHARPLGEETPPPLLIYGDNGTGKTTILRLVYALLAPIDKQGYKSYLYRTMFGRLEVHFDNGLVVGANKRTHGDSYNLFIKQRSGKTQSFIVRSDNSLNIMRSEAVDKFLSEIVKHVDVRYHHLSDERVLSPQAPYFRAIRHQHRRMNRRTTAGRDAFGGSDYDDEFDIRNHNQAPRALAMLENWFRLRSAEAARSVDENVNHVFLDTVRRASHLHQEKDSPTPELEKVLHDIETVSERNEPFARFGLTAAFPAKELSETVLAARISDRELLLRLVASFLETVGARLGALEEISSLADLFISTANSFLYDKTISFTIPAGFLISTRLGVSLDPELLSSGERHLVVILAHTVMARDDASVFFIDEPELSLNIKWQRQLIPALVKLSQGSYGQIIAATHSFEILAQSSESVVSLNDPE